MPVVNDNAGRKDDAGKDPWHLLPYDAVRGIVKVLAFGAKKYAPRNWERGMDWDRPYDACIRHLTAWWEGEKGDPETGFSHLWHAGCCVVFLIAFEMRGVGKDTRPGPVITPEQPKISPEEFARQIAKYREQGAMGVTGSDAAGPFKINY